MRKAMVPIAILFLSISVFGQDITGDWQGVVYQPNGPFTTYFPFSMKLTQNGSLIKGISKATLPGSPAFHIDSVSGQITNNTFSFTSFIISEIQPSGGYWCAVTGVLSYDKNFETLKGQWTASACSPGTIELWRLKVVSDTIFCVGTPVNLKVTGEAVKWYSDSSLNKLVSTGNSYSPLITTSTKYYITQTHFNTESPAITIGVTIKQKSFSTVNQSICQGLSYHGYSKTGIYTETLTAANGCDSIITLNLTVTQPIESTIDTSICLGNNINGHATPGTFRDIYKSVTGCDSVQITKLSILSLPNFSLGPDTSICQGDSITLNPGNFATYRWQDGYLGKQYSVKKAGTFSVTVSNSCGTKTDNIIITSKLCTLDFPSAFTPNKDGLNETFKALNVFYAQDYHLIIYNRWGQKIFETSDLTRGWDGNFQGQLQDAGVYVWYCRYTKDNLPMNKKGRVLLLR